MAPYTLINDKLGVIVKGINLSRDVSRNIIEQIKQDVHKYRLLIFKDQGIMEAKRQVEISRWFGELESTFYRHPKSPDLDIFRVSNVASEGCTKVGRTGWHIDGSFMQEPFCISIYHIISVPKEGNTVFAPLTDLIEQLSCPQRRKWERLWMLSDRRSNVIHPLIYSHPVTKKKVLCFHLGMTEAFIWDYGSPEERMTTALETERIIKEIHKECVKNNGAIQYSHKWEAGDFIISDNLAVGHEATPETQYSVSKVGLRVMHRTTIKGTNIPSKEYSLEQGANLCTCGKCEL